MVIDPDTYRRLSERERDEALEGMTMEESLAIGEALLTSEIMSLAEFPDDDHPQSLAISLGISSPRQGGRE
jgi:hypothetical protein